MISDEDDGFGPYLCLKTKRPCNPAQDHCRCWWLTYHVCTAGGVTYVNGSAVASLNGLGVVDDYSIDMWVKSGPPTRSMIHKAIDAMWHPPGGVFDKLPDGVERANIRIDSNARTEYLIPFSNSFFDR